MISIRIHFHGAIDRRGLPQDHVVTCSEDTTVESVLQQLGYPALQRKTIVPMMGGERKPMNHPVCDGDVLDILAPAGGG